MHADVMKRAQLLAVRAARRNHNKIRRLHHHAVRTDDMEATRGFYEDVLGMPMVAALKQQTDPVSGREMPFLHCFFEMGDGGSLAFFQFLPDAHGPANKLPPNAIDHHIAMSVPDFDDIVRYKARFDELGHTNCGINHGFCYSLYVRDPNGMLVELVADAPNELELNEAAAATAHRALAAWSRQDYRSNHADNPMVFPLPTSPQQQIERVTLHRSANRT
jgi:catechol 2,3-dioxygenase-like lactoylglutathione lyase family enzyme